MKTLSRSLFILFLVFFTFLSFGQFKSVKAAPLNTSINLGFKPFDSVIDPIKPVIYMTYKGSRTIYAVNYSTGEIKRLVLPYTAERLSVSGNILCVTQVKMNHTTYTQKSLTGAFAMIDTQTFTLKKVIDINTDPYDIAVDSNGYVYISPGSNQWGSIKTYSLETGEEISNPVYTNVYELSNIFYDPQVSKLYSIPTNMSPRDVEAFEVGYGMITNHYDSPNLGNYKMLPEAKITPDGAFMYNNSGVVYHLQTAKIGDMNYAFSLAKKYNDYAFSIDNQLTYAARTYGGIDVYKYGTNEYLYTICNDLQIQKLFFQNGLLLAIYSDNNGNTFVKSIDANTTGTPDVSPAPSNPTPPIDFSLAQSFINNGDQVGKVEYYDDFLDGAQNIGLDSTFIIRFNQSVYFNDATKISLRGPSGLIPIVVSPIADWGNNDGLTVVPHQLLSPDTTYTLTIQKGAILGYQNELVFNFKTGTYWKQDNGKTRFYYNSYTTKHYLIGWQTISGSRYYFNDAGEMQTGWNTINGSRYYFDSSGKMNAGWILDGGKWYYRLSDGSLQTGWFKDVNSWYYLDASGVMKTGWIFDGGKWYYLGSNGAMQTGWVNYANSWYYLDASGAMKTGWVYDHNSWYYLNSNGSMVMGWAKISGKWYYFYSNGIMAHDTKIGQFRLGHNGAML